MKRSRFARRGALNRDAEAIDVYNTVLNLQPRNGRAMLRLCRA